MHFAVADIKLIKYINKYEVQHIYSITHIFIYPFRVTIMMNSDADFEGLTDEEIKEEKKFQSMLNKAISE